MRNIFILLFFIFISSFELAEAQVAPGMAIEASVINSIKAQSQATQLELSQLKSLLSGKTIYQEYVLWSGNQYLDGSSIYTLWGSGEHKAWSVIELHISYDSGAVPQIVEVGIPAGYVYNGAAQSQSFLFTTHETIYRRIILRSTGIDILDGAGAGFYLRKVVGKVSTSL